MPPVSHGNTLPQRPRTSFVIPGKLPFTVKSECGGGLLLLRHVTPQRGNAAFYKDLAHVEPVFANRKADHGLVCADQACNQIGMSHARSGRNHPTDPWLNQVDASTDKMADRRLLNDTNGVNFFGADYALWDLPFMLLDSDRHIGRMLAMELEHCPKIDEGKNISVDNHQRQVAHRSPGQCSAVPMGRSSSTYSMCTPKSLPS